MDKEQDAAFEMLSRLVAAIETAPKALEKIAEAQGYKARVLHAEEVGINVGEC